MRFPTDPLGILVYLVGLLFLWAMVSVPVYFAGRAVKGKEAAFGDAMGATLGGMIAYYLVYFLVAYFLGAVVSSGAGVIALLMGLLAWLAVFRSAYRTTWSGAVAIVLVAWVILLAMDFVLVALFGVKFPDFFPF